MEWPCRAYPNRWCLKSLPPVPPVLLVVPSSPDARYPPSPTVALLMASLMSCSSFLIVTCRLRIDPLDPIPEMNHVEVDQQARRESAQLEVGSS